MTVSEKTQLVLCCMRDLYHRNVYQSVCGYKQSYLNSQVYGSIDLEEPFYTSYTQDMAE